MMKDPIVEQVREARRQTETACGGDWQKLVEHFLRIQKDADHPVTRGSARRLTRTAAEPPR